jgi:hypothetical protein
MPDGDMKAFEVQDEEASIDCGFWLFGERTLRERPCVCVLCVCGVQVQGTVFSWVILTEVAPEKKGRKKEKWLSPSTNVGT